MWQGSRESRRQPPRGRAQRPRSGKLASPRLAAPEKWVAPPQASSGRILASRVEPEPAPLPRARGPHGHIAETSARHATCPLHRLDNFGPGSWARPSERGARCDANGIQGAREPSEAASAGWGRKPCATENWAQPLSSHAASQAGLGHSCSLLISARLRGHLADLSPDSRIFGRDAAPKPRTSAKLGRSCGPLGEAWKGQVPHNGHSPPYPPTS